MKIAILISGFVRTIEYNFEKLLFLLKEHECDYYLHLSKNEDMDQYKNKVIEKDKLIEKINPIKCLVEDEIHFNTTKNINLKRMWYKIYELNNLKKDYEKFMNFEYDLVIRVRPDLYIIDDIIDFSKYVLSKDTIYGKYSGNIILDELNFGTSESMNKYCDLFLYFDEYSKKKILRPEIYLKYHCENLNLNLIDSKINHKLVLSLCNIIAISGDSGTGKTTLMKYLQFLFDKDLLKIEGDRYHKWERGDENWKKFTHLNPNANYIQKFSDDVYNLKIGNDIYQVDYDHSNGKFTEVEKLENKKNIILCGLHTLFDKNTNNLLDFKIYLDTDEKLRRYWKIKRDVKHRGYKKEKVISEIEKRVNDYEKYIRPQEYNCDLSIKFFTDDFFNYEDLDSEPNIYLKLTLNKKNNMIDFIEKLNINKVKYVLEKENNFSLIFYSVQKEFESFFNDIILSYCKKYSFEDNETSYYKIIISLIIFLFK